MNSIGNVISFMQQMQPEKIVPQREQRKGGLFNSLDADSSGGISQSEFEVLAQGISKFTGKEIDAGQVLKTYDADGNTELSGEELFQAMIANGVRPPPPPPMTKGGLFNELDTDSSGGISQSELEVLAQGISKLTGKEISAEEVIFKYDVDKNGELSGEELFQAMSGNGVRQPPPSFYEVKRGMAVYEMNSQDSTYQKLVRYVGSESNNLEKSSVNVSA